MAKVWSFTPKLQILWPLATLNLKTHNGCVIPEICDNTCTCVFEVMKTLYQASILERDGADYLESSILVRSLSAFHIEHQRESLCIAEIPMIHAAYLQIDSMIGLEILFW